MPSRRRLRFTPEADADFESLLQYSAQTWDEQQMRAYGRLIYDVLDHLAAFPGIGRRRDDLAPGLRSHPAGLHVIVHSLRDLATEFGS